MNKTKKVEKYKKEQHKFNFCTKLKNEYASRHVNHTFIKTDSSPPMNA